MGKKKKVGPVARFGSRYGRTPRKRLAEIEIEMRKWHVCPRCEAKAVKRKSVGVWQCRLCGYTFTGGAYIPITKLGEATRRSVREVSGGE